MRAVIFLTLFIVVHGAVPRSSQRIVGGITTTIDRYPFMAALLITYNNNIYYFNCGGSIINTRSILSAAHCTDNVTPWLRIRVGSTYSTSGGVVYSASEVFNHADYDFSIWSTDMDNDICIIRTATPIAFVDNLIQPALVAGRDYRIFDNDVVWPAGWGFTAFQGSASEQLRHAQTWVINQQICAARYAELGYAVTSNMICTGWLDMGGRGQCSGDSGGPVVHNGVVVGITSWSYQCVHNYYPTVSLRPSQYVEWIRERV